MAKAKKSLRDVARLSGIPLSETLSPSSILATPADSDSQGAWVTSPDLTEYGLPYRLEDIQDTVFFLLANPGLSSSVLFRADILADSDADTRTTQQAEESVKSFPARDVPGFQLMRTVVRRLVPRNSQLDRPLDQTCHFYLQLSRSESESKLSRRRFLAVYTPHVPSKEALPYYHPRLQSLALLYEYEKFHSSSSSDSEPGKPSTATATTNGPEPEPGNGAGAGTMSVHFLPYPAEPLHIRLERTLSNLLEVQIRITRGRLLNSKATTPTTQSAYAPIKDNVIPRHRVQDTYSRLKTKYAADLSARWVESTEPSKHVFEDLGVAAFLVELWRDMYGCVPGDERQQQQQASIPSDSEFKQLHPKKQFPGFVDIACGNGVLVYILLSEGYPGWGFDARRRKTWSIFPDDIQERLKEEIYIPKPFVDVLSSEDQDHPSSSSESKQGGPSPNTATSLSSLPRSTFIISNHTDELTLWTPLLSALLNPTSPPPFLAIPCCSHALSGVRYRYPPQTQSQSSANYTNPHPQKQIQEPKPSGNPETGDLAALRNARLAEQTPHSASFGTSTYGTLTDKLVAVSREVGFGVVKTLLRIPSTRNIGVLGGGDLGRGEDCSGEEDEEVEARVTKIVHRECAHDGGVYLAARNWVERARGLKLGGKSGHGHGHGHG
ncbi:hypothetical protein BDW62DRAFT_218041 [Aspergillus aurantiobrunneus]